MWVLPATPGAPHAERDAAEDEQDAQALEARRVIGLPEHDGGDADRDGQDDGEDEEIGLHRIPFERRSESSAVRTPPQ
jgi:hypothetical protein